MEVIICTPERYTFRKVFELEVLSSFNFMSIRALLTRVNKPFWISFVSCDKRRSRTLGWVNTSRSVLGVSCSSLNLVALFIWGWIPLGFNWLSEPMPKWMEVIICTPEHNTFRKVFELEVLSSFNFMSIRALLTRVNKPFWSSFVSCDKRRSRTLGWVNTSRSVLVLKCATSKVFGVLICTPEPDPFRKGPESQVLSSWLF